MLADETAVEPVRPSLAGAGAVADRSGVEGTEDDVGTAGTCAASRVPGAAYVEGPAGAVGGSWEWRPPAGTRGDAVGARRPRDRRVMRGCGAPGAEMERSARSARPGGGGSADMAREWARLCAGGGEPAPMEERIDPKRSPAAPAGDGAAPPEAEGPRGGTWAGEAPMGRRVLRTSTRAVPSPATPTAPRRCMVGRTLLEPSVATDVTVAALDGCAGVCWGAGAVDALVL